MVSAARIFEAQLALAKSVNLPVIIHSVKAHSEVLGCLKKHQLPRGGVIHAFSGSTEIALEYIKLGFKLGIGGLIMNPNAKNCSKLSANYHFSTSYLRLTLLQ